MKTETLYRKARAHGLTAGAAINAARRYVAGPLADFSAKLAAWWPVTMRAHGTRCGLNVLCMTMNAKRGARPMRWPNRTRNRNASIPNSGKRPAMYRTRARKSAKRCAPRMVKRARPGGRVARLATNGGEPRHHLRDDPRMPRTHGARLARHGRRCGKAGRVRGRWRGGVAVNRSPYLFRDVPPGALFERGGSLFIKSRGKARPHNGNPCAARVAVRPLDLCNVSTGEARGAAPARVVTVSAPGGDAPAPYREDWRPQPARGSVTACRFVVFYGGRWRRLYSDHSAGNPHFIRDGLRRLVVQGVAP